MTYKPSNYLYPNFCFEACTVATFNAYTTYAQYFQPNDTLNIGDNVTYTCKKDNRLVVGNLIRLCQDNGLWSGKEPICKRNYFSVSLRIKKISSFYNWGWDKYCSTVHNNLFSAILCFEM